MAEKKTNKPSMTEAEMDAVTQDTRELLRAQPTKSIRLYQTPPGQENLPDETVCINGYIYQIQRGVSVEVPESVYEVLEQAGRI